MQILGSRVRLSVAAVICPQRSHSGNLINPRQLNSFFFLWQNGRPNDVLGIHSILGIVVVFLCLSFFFFLFQGRRGPLGTAARCETCWRRARRNLAPYGRRRGTPLFSFFFILFSHVRRRRNLAPASSLLLLVSLSHLTSPPPPPPPLPFPRPPPPPAPRASPPPSLPTASG